MPESAYSCGPDGNGRNSLGEVIRDDNSFGEMLVTSAGHGRLFVFSWVVVRPSSF